MKKLFFWAVIGGIVYFFLSYHLIFIGGQVKFLKKSRLTLEYTFFSLLSKTPQAIIAIDPLREDGIGNLLVEAGKLSDKELEILLEKYRE